MKKVKLYAMAFAALFFAVSCQDDAIDSGQGQSTSEGLPAYLTISFTANGGSSTRAEGDNTGDKNGNAEDSGHHSNGDYGESDVNDALVIVAPVDGSVGFAKLYSADANGDLTYKDANSSDDTDNVNFTIKDEKSNTYTSSSAIRVATGKYKVLVVLNPVYDIETEFTRLAGSGQEITSGPDARSLYNFIVNGQYNTEGGITGTVSTSPSEDSDKYCSDMAVMKTKTEGSKGSFMMANQGLDGEKIVELDETNDASNPKSVTLDVERVISKVTYRIGENKNIYEVKVPGTVKAMTVKGYVKSSDLTTDVTASAQAEDEYQEVILNVATDKCSPTPNTVFVYYTSSQEVKTMAEKEDKPDFVAVFRSTGVKYSTLQSGTTSAAITRAEPVIEDGFVYEKITANTQEDYNKEPASSYVVTDKSDPEASLTLIASESGEYQTWYVKLIGYALVNVSKDVYYVRHTINGSNLAAPEPFGSVASRYLYTPYFNEKSTVDFTEENGTVTFPAGTNPKTWFYNTLAEVSDETKTLTWNSTESKFQTGTDPQTTDSNCFLPLPASGKGDEVTNDSQITGDSPQHNETLAKTGARLAYIFENSVMADHQTHGLTTGIVFVGQVYTSKDDSGAPTTPAKNLFYYNNHVFQSIADIKKAYSNVDPNNELSEDSSREELAAFGITPFTESMCYYYTSRIKHFDDGNDTNLGMMEYAIMRNNIYSLAVTGISDIGTPIVDPTPDTPNESQEAALSLQVNILPWIVRYNDIEF